MAVLPGISFSIDISGLWSPRQADAVIAALRGETISMGLVLAKVDVTCFSHDARCLIEVRCAIHDEPIPEGWACGHCLAPKIWPRT